MTVCGRGRSPPPAPPPGEPLLQSVRLFLQAPPPRAVCKAPPAPLAPPTSHADIGDPGPRGDVNNNARAAMPSQAELLQRQPLLARAKPAPPGAADDDEPAAPRDFVLDIPPPAAPRDDRFPKEVWKTIVSFLFLFLCVCVNMASLSLVHERLPDRNTTAPLPDIVLDNVAARDWGLTVSEYLIMVSTTVAMLVVVFHKHRFIVSRRLFFIIGLLYLYRSVTMFVTVLPMSSTTYYCSPKSNATTPLLVLRRTFYLISGFGLSINGKHTFCGDYIYSGHTMVLVLSYLIAAEYSPRRLWALQWALWAAAALGVVLVLLAHSHYTVDVVIAYYVTTRLWWSVHALLAGGARTQLAREWWWRGLAWLERNVRGPVPRRYDWPLPWPRTKLFARLS